MSNTPWDFGDLDGYIREGEPDRAQRAENWQVAIGLQAVDGLTTSPYLLQTARAHIEGRIDIGEVQRRIRSYYDERADREEVEGEQEADIVSGRIAELLGERAFTLSPVELCHVHRRLFDQMLPRAGKYRNYNITKKEWVLKGETVLYASYGTIAETLRYDFAREHDFSYAELSNVQIAHHMARFASGIWQIHPFGEGNTRSTAVFVIKYLRAMGYKMGNEPFKNHSWYFRNALVRANYEDVTRHISPDMSYLERFFENLLCGTRHELRNRYLHLDWAEWQSAAQGEVGTTQETVRTAQETEGTTQEVSDSTRSQILKLLMVNPKTTARQIADELGISFDGVRYHLARLSKEGAIRHEGPRKGGHWVVRGNGNSWANFAKNLARNAT